ncbi:unnamed protein product, partial [Darwinula stevensoni]
PASNDGCPVKKADFKEEAVKATQALQNLEFDSGKSTIRAEGQAKLDAAASIIKANTGKYMISGHTDNTGSAALNQKLSQARAQAVVKALESRGVESGRLLAKGFGSSKPIADNKTAEGKQQNRRVEVGALSDEEYQQNMVAPSTKPALYNVNMAKKKIQRFKENETFKHLFQPNREDILSGFSLKSKWNKAVFKNDFPIILELGCGKGEYTIEMAKKHPEYNFIGIDLKGARLWRGAKSVQEESLKNVAFIRTQIELIEYLFFEQEISEIWITFPDPQIKYRRAKHRLTHPFFLEKYKKILKTDGVIHLKTDSDFLYGYTHGIIQEKNYTVLLTSHNIYHPDAKNIPEYVTEIKTFYENKFLSK